MDNPVYEQQSPEAEEQIDYEKLVDFFSDKGIDGLNNGLSAEPNERLFTTSSGDYCAGFAGFDRG